MTVFYRDASVVVDSGAIRTCDGVYPVRELRDILLVRGPYHRDRLALVLVLRLSVGVAAAVLLAAVVALLFDVRQPTHGAVPAWLVYGYVFASPVVLGALIRAAERTHDRGSRDLLLCARHRGTDVVLFTTTNATVFGQVHRALLRALEYNGGPTAAQR
jgi:hypothetical protein